MTKKNAFIFALMVFVFSARSLVWPDFASGNFSSKKGVGQDYKYPMRYCNTTDINNTCVVNYMNKVESLGITWLYVWGLITKPAWLDSSIEFVPMVFSPGTGPNRSYTSAELKWYSDWAKLNPGSHWLIWNEPDLNSSIPPLVAAGIYKPLYDAIKQADPTAKFIVGGLAYINFAPDSWINTFRNEYNRLHGQYPPLDGWACHDYEFYNSDNFRRAMNIIHNWLISNNYGEKEFWLTEFGDLGSNEIGLTIIQEQLEWLEDPAQSWITRYAWFHCGVEGTTFMKGNLLTGSLNDLGSAQLSPLGLEYAKHPINSTNVRDAEVRFLNVPAKVNAGENFAVSVEVKNKGLTYWSEKDGYGLGTQDPTDNLIWGKGRIYLADNEVVFPNSSKVFTFDLKAPDTVGNQKLSLRMLQERVEWFGDKATTDINIEVGSVPITLSLTTRLGGISVPGVTKAFRVYFRSGLLDRSYEFTAASGGNGIFSVSSLPLAGLTPGSYTVYIRDISSGSYRGNRLRKSLGTITLSNGLNTAPSTWSTDSQYFLKPGDVIRDGTENNVVNITDIAAELSVYTALSVPVNETNRVYDLNGDNRISVEDISLVLGTYTALSVPGD